MKVALLAALLAAPPGALPRSAGQVAGYGLTPLAGSTASGASYGADVAVAGDVVVVGAPFDKSKIGAAYIHTRVDGTWSQRQLLENPLAGIYYGRAVTLAGPRMIVTSYAASNTQALVGALDGSWVSDGLLAAPAQPTAGADAIVRDDTALLGVADQNLVLAFHRGDPSTWTKSQVAPLFGGVDLTAAFGARLASGGPSLAVAAPRETEIGAVYLYRWPGTTSWTHEARLAPAVADGTYGFGAALAVAPSGERLAVGAPNGPADTAGDGAVYLFRREERGTWTLEALLLPPADGTPLHRYGAALALTDEVLAIGSPGDADGAGRVHIFTPRADGWALDLTLPTADDPEAPLAGDAFGAALAIDGRRLVVGAPSATTLVSDAPIDTGRAFVIDLTFAGGAPCISDDGCATGACVDGVCCDGPCAGPCEACAAALGAMSDGTCTKLCPDACDEAQDLCEGAGTSTTGAGGSSGGGDDATATAPAIELDPFDTCACVAAASRPPLLLVLLAVAARRRRPARPASPTSTA